jgi:hypothetical protein
MGRAEGDPRSRNFSEYTISTIITWQQIPSNPALDAPASCNLHATTRILELLGYGFSFILVLVQCHVPYCARGLQPLLTK